MLFKSRRVDTKEYKEIVAEILALIPNCIDVPSFSQKSSWGDADLLCDLDSSKIHSILWEKLGTVPHVNGNVYSFIYRDFQIDLIKTIREKWTLALFCLKFSTGMMVGRLCDPLGLKLSFQKGLVYRVEYKSNYVGEFKVEDDPAAICDLLGLDYAATIKGFREESEMWEWLLKSPYFDPSLFSYENLTHKNRARNSKRPEYARFLTFINERFPDPNKDARKLNKEAAREQAKRIYPFIIDKEKEIWNSCLRSEELARKFNGLIVMEITGLKGKELGGFIASFKTMYASEIEAVPAESIKELIRKFHERSNLKK